MRVFRGRGDLCFLTLPFAVLFTGGTRTESIKLWDLRAKKVVYELATGNNGAVSFAWDAQNTILYATTASEYVDILGNHCDYRPYRPPKFEHATSNQSANQDNNLKDSTEDEDNAPQTYHNFHVPRMVKENR